MNLNQLSPTPKTKKPHIIINIVTQKKIGEEAQIPNNHILFPFNTNLSKCLQQKGVPLES